MFVKKAEFILSAVRKEQYPNADLPDVAFAGRSNAGKSSLLNALVNRKNLAKKGRTPGVTSLINFFNVNDGMHLVDLPGYGYAASAKGERDAWDEIINTYLGEREQLKFVLLLVDIRHAPSQDDCIMYNWIRYSQKPHAIIASKLDKINRSQTEKRLKEIREVLQLPSNINIIPVSSEKRTGIDRVWEEIESVIGHDL